MGGTVVVSSASMLSIIDADVYPTFSIGILHGGRFSDDPTYIVTSWHGGIHPRVSATLPYIKRLHQLRPATRHSSRGRTLTLFQADDNPHEVASVSWHARRAWSGVRLVPDVQYFTHHGYERFLSPGLFDLPPWECRRNGAIWRGSTTGTGGITLSSIETLPRVRLCTLIRSFGLNCDAGITGVTQVVLPDEQESIERLLASEGLLRRYVPFREMGFYKLVIDIDGNASSWNFLAKLRLGSCVVKVDSDWSQWFTARLIPWRHYVPVTSDLADLEEKIDWCLLNDGEAQQIAQAGREFALNFSLDRELSVAARNVFEPQTSEETS